MYKKGFKELFIYLMTIPFVGVMSSIAMEGHIYQGGYNYNHSVIVNWYSEDKQLIKEKKESIKKTDYKDLNFSVTKTIIIDSSTVKKKKMKKDYVIVQHTINNSSYVSSSYTLDKKKDEIDLKKPKPITTTKKDTVDELIEMRIQKQYPPTMNTIVEEQRIFDADKSKKNKKIQLATKKIMSLDLNKYNEITKKKEQFSKVKTKKNYQYANTDNPFDDTFDSPSNVENYTKSKVKKTKAPSYNPLIQFPLSEYTVKGVITSEHGNRALITTAQGNYFYLREGELLGANKGVVDKIKNNSVVILERDRRIEIIVSSDGRVSRK